MLFAAVQVALPRVLGGLEAMMMYIDTEGKFSTQVIRTLGPSLGSLSWKLHKAHW